MSIAECKSCGGNGFVQPRGCGCREAMCPHGSRLGDVDTEPQPGLYQKFWVSYFARGEVVCSAPVIVWPARSHADAFIGEYVWLWGRSVALPLGLISLFNHSARPNTGSERQFSRRRIVCRALRDITGGEEILIDYGCSSYDFKIIEK